MVLSTECGAAGWLEDLEPTVSLFIMKGGGISSLSDQIPNLSRVYQALLAFTGEWLGNRGLRLMVIHTAT